MDSGTPSTPSRGPYTEHVNPQGRKYWYDTVNKTSHWEKPAALQSPFERAMAATPWKEYTSNGRRYWVHGETKKSVWDMPDELVKLRETHPDVVVVAPPPLPPPSLASPASGGAPSPMKPAAGITPAVAAAAGLPQTPRGHGLPDGPLSTSGHSLALTTTTGGCGLPPAAHDDASPFNGAAQPSPEPTSQQPPTGPQDRFVIPPGGFPTVQQAEEAFEYLLEKTGVDVGWTWDVAMRAIITDPLYKALATLAEKKAVFNKYLANLKTTREAERAQRLTRFRPQFAKLLNGHPQIYSYSTFRTVSEMFKDAPVWKHTRDDERKLLWDEFVADLKAKEAAEERDLRKRNMTVLNTIFDELSLTPYTRWPQFHSMLSAHPTFTADPHLAAVDPIDVLGLYEERMAAVERAYEEQRAKERVAVRRAARHAREAFKRLLEKHVDEGRITWESKWRACLPLWRDTDEYRALLGKSGSSPLDLFHDTVDDLTAALEGKAKSVRGLLETVGVAVELSTTRGAFDEGLDKIKFQGSAQDREDLWAIMHGRLVAKAVEEERRRERRRRYAIDDLRYALRKVEPALSLDAPYEEVEKQIEKLREAKDVEDPEDRRAAWEKHVKRQKEKLREREEERSGPSSSGDGYHHRHSRASYDGGGRERSHELPYGSVAERGTPKRSERGGTAEREHGRRDSRGSYDGASGKRGLGAEEERAVKRPKTAPEDLEEGEI